MSRLRVKPLAGDELRVELPGGAWSGVVLGLAALAAGGGVIERLPPQAMSLLHQVAVRLGHVAEEVGAGRLRLEYVAGRAGGEYVLNVGCSLDYATLVGVAAGVLAPPGARIVLRGCEELVEADWRPLLETVSAYGGRAYPAGSPRSLVVIEAVGRGRLRSGIWRLQVRSDSTVAHVAAAIIASLASDSTVYIHVWPVDPHSKTDIDPAVYAASVLANIEYSTLYNRFRISPGGGGETLLVNRPDASLALHLAGLAALGVRVDLEGWAYNVETPYDPLVVASLLLEQLGYTHERSGGGVRVGGTGEQVKRSIPLREYPEYAAPLVTLVAARGGEARLEELPSPHIQEANDVASIFLPLGFSLETRPDALVIRRSGEPQQLVFEELVATCTTPHVLPASVVAARLASRPFIVERGDCLRHLWPSFYDTLGGDGVLEKI